MSKNILFLCNGISRSDYPYDEDEHKAIELNANGANPNVNIQFNDIKRKIVSNISPRNIDFLEIAAYIFSADVSINRGESWKDDDFEPWKRNFKLVIAVRDLGFWNRKDVIGDITEILTFLSDDEYELEFRKLENEAINDQYFEFDDTFDEETNSIYEKVIMFSGGLDSLAGVLDFAQTGKKAILVSHRPVAKLAKRQSELFDCISEKHNNQFLHIPVWVNKSQKLSREHTQRTRSFLFVALGSIIGMSLGVNCLSFYENGIVSLNLPIADEVIRARASRTTHPIVIELYNKLITKIYNKEYKVDNPYIFYTKRDIVDVIVKTNNKNVVCMTCSCAHTGFFQSKTQWHCGSCSQCIDRRVAILSTGILDLEESIDYVSDVFIGERKEGYQQNYAINFLRYIVELKNMSEDIFLTRYSHELFRATRFLINKKASISKLINMHFSYASYAYDVLCQQLNEHIKDIVNGSIPEKSLVSFLCKREHLGSQWNKYAERIVNLLRIGIPVACKSVKPRNEPHLQEICDSILKSNDEKLIREYPFMRWSLAMTKPDWSKKELNLWIELKYIKQKQDVRRILRDIAEDLTKYGDNKLNVLFIVYDPFKFIIDPDDFKGDIISHANVVLYVI